MMLDTTHLYMGRHTDMAQVQKFRSLLLASVALTVGLEGLLCAEGPNSPQTEFSDQQLDYFETSVRPLLVRKCYRCHSSESSAVKGGLKLDQRKFVLRGGDSGTAVVPGKPDQSLLIQAIRYESNEMPPDGKLKAAEIQTLVRWVEMGVPWPENSATAEPVSDPAEVNWDTVRNRHWAWKPIVKPEPPEVPATWLVRNPIDRFVGNRLHEAGLSPSPPAEIHVLCRRIWIDLVGFPPPPEKVAAFLSSAKSDYAGAVSDLVEELLQSPHYGERWGRHWLDVARYSDGFGGFLDNAALPHAWRYRDWVVSAFNRDLPYSEFVRLQIAGDLIAPDERAGVATGFLALGPTYRSDGGDPESVAQAKGETLDDRVDTVTRGLLGVTVSCARCHDHKFDPIPQQDYYSLAGVFNNTRFVEYALAEPDVVKQYQDRQNEIRQIEKLQKELAGRLKKEKREPDEDEQKNQQQWKQQIDQLRKSAPPKYPVAHALTDSGSGDMKVALRGDLRKPGAVAPRRFLRLIEGAEPRPYTSGSGRIELADSITSRENPLVTRVFVNRVWLQHFGKALVRSPGNFGKLGQQPTHPELLDWLAVTFMDKGWSIKSLHRLIMNSATYQMSSRMNDSAYEVDGDNNFLWRMNPRRVDVETWRDSLLSVTGEIDLTLGGSPIADIEVSRRRTLYAQVSRNGDRFDSDRFLQLFDFPLMRATVAKRPTSIVPQQFLFMLNSAFMKNRGQALVGRLKAEADSDVERIRMAYRLLYAREATSGEERIGLAYLAGVQQEPVAPVQPSQTADPDADILVADFEGDSYGEWDASGEAFGQQPARGTLPGQMAVSGFLGRGLVNSYRKGDGTVGRLSSPEFLIERPFLRFLIGGGGYAGTTCMNLVVDGRTVRTAVGPNTQGGGTENLAWAVWDVRELRGRKGVLEIIDRRTGGWGHINVDHIFQSARKNGPVPGSRSGAEKSPVVIDRWVQYAQVLLSSNEFMYVR